MGKGDNKRQGEKHLMKAQMKFVLKTQRIQWADIRVGQAFEKHETVHWLGTLDIVIIIMCRVDYRTPSWFAI